MEQKEVHLNSDDVLERVADVLDCVTDLCGFDACEIFLTAAALRMVACRISIKEAKYVAADLLQHFIDQRGMMRYLNPPRPQER